MLVAGSPPRRTGGNRGEGPAGSTNSGRTERMNPTPGSLRPLGIAPTGALVAVAAPTSRPRPYLPLPPIRPPGNREGHNPRLGDQADGHFWRWSAGDVQVSWNEALPERARGLAVISRLGIQRLASWAASQRLSVSSQEVHRCQELDLIDRAGLNERSGERSARSDMRWAGPDRGRLTGGGGLRSNAGGYPRQPT
jgi:hypothetical protein